MENSDQPSVREAQGWESSSPPPPPLPPQPRAMARWRWAVHLAILAAYPLLMGLAAYMQRNTEQAPILHANIPFLLFDLAVQLVFFAFLFGLAWLASRVRANQLYVRPEPFWRSLGLGFLYSLGLRALVAGAVLVTLGVLAVLSGNLEAQVDKLRPQSEALIDTQALASNPLYLIINLTFVSFIVAGLREELWRAGMLAGFFGLFPKLNQSAKGRWLVVGLTAVVFGLGHVSQGPGGVVLTTVLGLGLGFILIWRRSFWEAVLAHGFFDATTFGLMFLLARFWPHLLPGSQSAGLG